MAATASTVEVQEAAYGHIASQNDAGIVTEVAKISDIMSTEAIVRSYFADIPVMIDVARCESAFRHTTTDGSILLGRIDPADTGVMQINKRYHQKSATAMQINLDDVYGNMEYARYLYETQGTRPWSASMPCWGSSLAANY